MPARELKCPRCGEPVHIYRNPIPTVDVIIEVGDKVVLISRKNPPYGWAIPGGFVDYGESLEEAAVREAREETGLEVKLLEQFYTYSDPERDPRHHTITTVYIAKGEGIPKGLDDAREAGLFSEDGLPEPLVFDHGRILRDYFEYRRTGRRPAVQPRTSHSLK
ncbi:MAG: NUDIX hydrolase [Candidatus Latescibacterota bacterium]|nr:MAG: NUDIX hydrolase [Candidatus Latescibacterota bacterium]